MSDTPVCRLTDLARLRSAPELKSSVIVALHRELTTAMAMFSWFTVGVMAPSSDDALEALWKKEYSLTALTAADQFKSYEQLENRLKMVLGQKSAPARLDEEVSDEDNDRGSYAPDFSSRRSEPTPAKIGNNDFNAPDITPKSSSSEDEDDALSYFQKLAEE